MTEIKQTEMPNHMTPFLMVAGGMTCCGNVRFDSVRFNPLNNVVQCHSCGCVWGPQMVTSRTPETDDIRVIHRETKKP